MPFTYSIINRCQSSVFVCFFFILPSLNNFMFIPISVFIICCISEMLSEEFHISLEDAADLLKAQMNKKCFRKFLTDEIEKFSPNEVREIRKSAIYVADEEGNLTDRIKDNKKIVWFGNECVRRCNVDLKDIPLLDQFLLLKCGSKALTGVLNQIVERGVNLDGKHYLFYTSTTGQMKETEITLVEEEYWKENEYALMCGLTEERINSKGGINMGKYFAAKALNLSNSIKYDSGISIDEVIIVPDFKTFVSGMVNYLDVNTLDIQEKKMEIEIEHMDGAGIFIPGNQNIFSAHKLRILREYETFSVK